MKRISTLLVANRGEIAVRVMRTASSMGIKTVAVYSEADANSPHVQTADDAVCIGPAPVAESYLRGERIIEAALAQGADAIHPGYGFLSENGDFARAVVAAGLTFIGPSADAIDIMGDKAQAKRRMIAAGVPCVPGYEGEDQSLKQFSDAAAQIGFPIMVKAAAGGGGRGMRLVTKAQDLKDAIKLASSEAMNAFGSNELILEKAIARARHVEIQVFADHSGNTIHLGERDCSVQRRHQKIIEEAPCPVMTSELREAMGQAAVEAARAVNYYGAGTVEFLLDEAGIFYFLEMNTRLQVEHPVTELVTGLDLVALQIAIAEGQPLEIDQSEVTLKGHAIEVRLYAEDPAHDFLPSTGAIHYWQPADNVRTDAGIASGGAISPFYDSMVAKIIGFGTDREEARRNLIAGLKNTVLFGPATNRDFLIDALQQPIFAQGEATTAFINETYGAEGWSRKPVTEHELAIAGVVSHVLSRSTMADSAYTSDELLDWSSAGDLKTCFHYHIGDRNQAVNVHPTSFNNYEVQVGESIMVAHVHTSFTDANSNQAMKLTLNQTTQRVHHWRSRDSRLFVGLPSRTFSLRDAASLSNNDSESLGDGTVTAPMHGQLLEIFVAEGDRVCKGDKLAVLEAMKMQHAILADIDGLVTSVLATAGSQLAADQRILEIEPIDD